MWPFTRKSRESKVDPDDADYIDCSQFMNGERTQNLTEEERVEVDRAFNQFRDDRYHPEIANNLLSAVAAAALCNYASWLINRAADHDLGEEVSASELSNKAISAARKAIDLYPNPILFGRLADFLERTGWANDANTIREAQRSQESVWVDKRTDELLMIRLDPEFRIEEDD